MKRFRDVGFRSIAAIVIAALAAGCSGGSAQSPLPSTVSSLPAAQPIAHSQIKAQASGIAAFVIPAINGAAYNVAQWSSVEFPATHSTVFVGTDSYNNVAYSFTVTSDPATGYFMFSTSDGMYAIRANSSAQTYTASRGSNPNRDMNILNALKFDMVDAELGGGGGGPGGPGGRNPAAEKHAQSQPQPVDVLIKGITLVAAVAAFGGALLAVPALIVAVSATIAVVAVAATGLALLAAALDYANTLGAFDQDNGPAPNIDPPSSNGPPSVSDFCRPIVYEGIAGLDCTFYY